MQLLPPARFRLHEDDHERYGDGWTVYDESAITRIPARHLVDIEATIGMSVLAMVARMRDLAGQHYTEATLAGTWVARRLAGVDEPYDSYEPLVHLMTWEPAPAGDADPPEGTPSPSPAEG